MKLRNKIINCLSVGLLMSVMAVPSFAQNNRNVVAPVSDELQVSVQAENSLELALSTNQITFANYNGTQDFTNDDLDVTVSSGLNYDLSATMLEEFTPTFDSSAVMPSELLSIKTSTDNDYKEFTTVGTPIMLVENASNGKNVKHDINFKLKGDSSVKADTYNTTIRFEATQK